MSRSDVIDLRVRRRLSQIADRLDELRARSREISGPLAPEVPQHDRLVRAAGHASRAGSRAAKAARLARAAYLHSASVHDRVADLYDRLAAGAGGAIRYQRQAHRHRMLAATDRVAARTGHTGEWVESADRVDEEGE